MVRLVFVNDLYVMGLLMQNFTEILVSFYFFLIMLVVDDYLLIDD